MVKCDYLPKAILMPLRTPSLEFSGPQLSEVPRAGLPKLWAGWNHLEVSINKTRGLPGVGSEILPPYRPPTQSLCESLFNQKLKLTHSWFCPDKDPNLALGSFWKGKKLMSVSPWKCHIWMKKKRTIFNMMLSWKEDFIEEWTLSSTGRDRVCP